MKKQHVLIAILVVVLIFVPLALPYQMNFSYWAESTWFWIASILVGAVAAVYVFYIFLQIRRQIVQQAKEEREEQP